MSWKMIKKPIGDLFSLQSGNFHATKDLDTGNVPLISCGDTDNGLVGYFDIPVEKRHKNCITVAYNGQPLLAKFHPYEFGAKDDVAVLTPLTPIKTRTLFYIAALLNNMIWKYSYGRKCFREKLRNVQIPVPITDGIECIDEDEIAQIFPREFKAFLPKPSHRQLKLAQPMKWGVFAVTDLLAIKRGDFHSLTALGNGDSITVSRVTSDNGVVGYYEPPDKAKLYSHGSITVSTVGGDAFVQLDDFIATDNILICSPNQPMEITTLFFVAMILNSQKWRYSYGRQCYKTKFSTTKIQLPIMNGGKLDESYMKIVVENTVYWSLIKSHFGLYNKQKDA